MTIHPDEEKQPPGAATASPWTAQPFSAAELADWNEIFTEPDDNDPS